MVQLTSVIPRQLGAKILQCELSGSQVISCFCAKAETRDLQDHIPVLWRLHHVNSMLSDNRWTCILRISTHNNFPPATNHKKPYQISIIIQQKLPNYISQHTMDTVFKSSKPRHGSTINRNGLSHFSLFLPKLHELLSPHWQIRKLLFK